MQKLYLYDIYDNTYNVINITNQTSTRWRDTLEEAIAYDKVSTRKLKDNWGKIADKPLPEVIEWIRRWKGTLHILEIIDESQQHYEYW